jgi:signal transduction histidine kinase
LVVARLLLPSDGLSVDPTSRPTPGGLTVQAADAVPGIARGDAVVAVNGQSVPDLVRSAEGRDVRAGQHLVYRVRHDGFERDVIVELRHHAWRLPLLAAELPALVFYVSLLGLALWLVHRRPDERAAHVLLVLAVALASGLFDPLAFYEPLDFWARPALVGWTMATWSTFMEMGLCTLLLALTFPAPSPRFARHPWIAAALVAPAAFALQGVVVGTGHGSLGVIDNSNWVLGWWFYGLTTGAAVVVAVRRWFKLRRDPLLRRRIQIALLGLAVTVGTLVVFNFVGGIPEFLYLPALAVFPASLALALATRDWFELDIVLNRGLVAVLCSGALLALYLGIAAVTAHVAGTTGALASLPAAGVVAVSFAPLRWRIQGFIDRRLFGTSSDPRLLFHGLGMRLAASDDPESLMAAVVETARESLRLPYAAVQLRAYDGWHTVEERGSRPSDVEVFNLAAGEEVVGRLIVAPRRDVGVLSPSDRELLNDLARHSGVAARVAGLLTDLRAAQQRLLVAREAERDRIHRDLHDGVGPSLVGLTLQLEVAAELAADSQLGGIIARLHREAARATEDVRRMVRDLRPADLDELGLPAAVAAAAARLGAPGGPRLDLDCPIRLPELSKDVEDAAYKICLEAMANAVRHSTAAHCAVRLRPGDGTQLVIEVADDGRGMGGGERLGTGLRSMQDRAQAVGGWLRIHSEPGKGTTIQAGLPTGAR